MPNYRARTEAHDAHNEVEVGFAVNLLTLREVLKNLNIRGRRWWIASDPADAINDGFLAIGYGDQGCVDRLNTIYFRLPVLTQTMPWGGIDRILLLLDPASLELDQPGLYLEDGLIKQDFLADFDSFYGPLKQALIRRLQAAGSASSSCESNEGIFGAQTEEQTDGKDEE